MLLCMHTVAAMVLLAVVNPVVNPGMVMVMAVLVLAFVTILAGKMMIWGRRCRYGHVDDPVVILQL